MSEQENEAYKKIMKKKQLEKHLSEMNKLNRELFEISEKSFPLKSLDYRFYQLGCSTNRTHINIKGKWL